MMAKTEVVYEKGDFGEGYRGADRRLTGGYSCLEVTNTIDFP